jgi:uncharacterized protein YkwD
VIPPDDEEEKVLGDVDRCLLPLNEDGLVDEIFDRIQMERDKFGLPPLVMDQTLCDVADEYACTMVEGGFFAHDDPSTGLGPGARVTASGYVFISIGENLAAGQRTPADVVAQWMESASHRDNILGPTWRETGIAVRMGGDYGVYWVQIFADPADFGEPALADAAYSTPDLESDDPDTTD